MNKEWPTKSQDIRAAQAIMEEYANETNSETLGMFELVVDQEKKRMDFKLSSWVVAIASHFKSKYGEEKGDSITRLVLTYCITRNETIH